MIFGREAPRRVRVKVRLRYASDKISERDFAAHLSADRQPPGEWADHPFGLEQLAVRIRHPHLYLPFRPVPVEQVAERRKQSYEQCHILAPAQFFEALPDLRRDSHLNS